MGDVTAQMLRAGKGFTTATSVTRAYDGFACVRWTLDCPRATEPSGSHGRIQSARTRPVGESRNFGFERGGFNDEQRANALSTAKQQSEIHCT